MSKILIVGQTPPPFHGQAVVTQMLFDQEWEGELEVICLRMAYSKHIDEVGATGLGKVLHLFALILKTWWIIITKRPQVLYYPPAGGNTVPIIRDLIYLGLTRFLFRKTVFHFHAGGLTDYLKQGGLIAKLANWAYHKPDVSIELYQEPDSPGKFLKAKKIEIVQNGLEVQYLDHKKTDSLELLFVGSLSESKGVIELIKTAQLLREHNYNINIKVAGQWADEAFKAEAIALVKQAGLADMIDFIGLVQGDYKWKVYNEADIFFFPSHYEAEKFPLVLIEAMGCNCAIISTNWRGIPQLVEGSNAAILCDIKSPQQYATAITELCNNKNRLEQMQQAARAHYLANYSKDKFIARMSKIFTDLNS